MGVISGTGVFSGIDSAKIIDQLLTVERKPIDNLKSKKADYNTKISKWGNIANIINNLKSSLTNLKAVNLVPYRIQSSNSNVISAMVSSNVQEGVYNIKVIKLAEAQSVYSAKFSSANEEIANLDINPVQKISVRVGSGEEKIITIDSTNNSLSGLKNAINGLGLKIRANIINDGAGYRLVINSNETGSDNKIVIKVDENNDGVFEGTPDEIDNIGLSMLAFNATYDNEGNVTGGISNLTQAKKALDAVLEVDGITLTRSKNEISDLIDNVTIKLQNLSNGENVKIIIDKDYSLAEKNLNAFVTNYNNLMNALKDESLKDDAISRQLINSVRNILTNSYNSKTLTNYGLNHDKTAVLSLDSSKLMNALKNNFSDVINTLDSVESSLDSNLKIYLDNVIPARKENYKRMITNIEKRVEIMEDKLTKFSENYRKKFYELEKTIAGLQKSGDYVTQTLSKWGNSK
ncbi:MAG: flagellar filament capping protein FliD [Proteobacteria bacterium]|nr:flagellar filament capping protein FliD [Pseudomonadota bacterium]